MDNIIDNIRQTLRENIDEKTVTSGKKFFKEEIEMYGVRVPVVHNIAKEYFSKIKKESKENIFALCEELWRSGYNEETYIACDWSYWMNKHYVHADFEVFEKWVDNYVNNWASCDTLCNHTIGTFMEMYPEYVLRLKTWAHSDNRWTRRAAAVTLIIPARKGMFLQNIFEIADVLLTDGDDLVHKGYGWMLKAAADVHMEEVFNYVMSKKSVMPRTALRYAIEKMPQEMKAQAMK